MKRASACLLLLLVVGCRPETATRPAGVGAGSGGVSVAGLRHHPFWKTPPSEADLLAAADGLCDPGAHGYLCINDGGDLWFSDRMVDPNDPRRQGKFTLFDAAFSRARDRQEALRTIKDWLDKKVAEAGFSARH